MARIDHSNCTHPRTPAGRRACRNGSAPVITTPAPADNYIAAHIRATAANAAVKARMDARYDGLAIETPAGDIREGSIIIASVRGGGTERYTVLSVEENIKNGYAGWNAEGRWGYADQVVRVVTY